MRESWSEDVLGEGFLALTLPLGVDDEGERVATLVAFEPHRPVPAPGSTGLDEGVRQSGRPTHPLRAVLYLHGFSDYFLHAGLARAVHDDGWSFFGLDLHKYGRSLRPGQTPGFVSSLEEYDADLDAAITALTQRVLERREASHGVIPTGSAAPGSDPAGADPTVEVVIVAHSMGGLTATLWAARNPGRISGLVLNSPWLDTQGSALLRSAAQGILDTVSRRRPKTRLRLPELGFYFRSISDVREGEWTIDARWRPETGFPIRAGWLAAIFAGHAGLAKGVSVDAPILVVCSAASTISPTWSDAMLETDIILDVAPMVRRAAELGPDVTIRRFPGALHDVFLSRSEVRGRATDVVRHWLRTLPDRPSSGPPAEASPLVGRAVSGPEAP